MNRLDGSRRHRLGESEYMPEAPAHAREMWRGGLNTAEIAAFMCCPEADVARLVCARGDEGQGA